MCCLKRTPFNRKNVYKLLEHPFVQHVKLCGNEEDEKTEFYKPKIGEDKNDQISKSNTPQIRTNSRKPNNNTNNKKDSLTKINMSNYDRILLDYEKKGNKDQLILELQRNLDNKTIDIESKLKAKRYSQVDSKNTPNSESENIGQHFFPKDLGLFPNGKN